MHYRPTVPGQQARTLLLRRWRAIAPVVIFVLAVLTRLDFVLNYPQVSSGFGDQSGYEVAAETIVAGLHFQFPGVFGAPPELSEDATVDLDHEYRQVFWDATARNGVWPLLMTPAYLTADPIHTLQIIQAILFSTVPLAMILIARRVTTPSIAWFAGLVGALYPPLIIASGRFLQQGPATVLITWGVVCLLYLHKRKIGPWLIIGGYAALTLAGYILLATRPLMLLLMVVFPVGMDWRNRIAKWGFLGGLALVILLWSLTVSGYRNNDLGDELLKNSLGMSPNNISSAIGYNIGVFLETELWRTDDTFLPDVLLPERAQLLDVIVADPANALGGILTNGYRMFLQPYNAFGQPYGLDYAGQVALHQILLGLATLGALVCAARPQHGRGMVVWFALSVIGLVFAVYATTHIEARYLSILIPLQIVLALVGMRWLVMRARIQSWGLLGGVLLVNAIVSVPVLLSVFPAMSPATAHAFDALLAGISWVGATGAVIWTESPTIRLSIRNATSRYSIPASSLTIALGLAISVLVGGGSLWEPNWRGWTVEIAPGERVQQIITLGDFEPLPGTIPILLLDVGAPAQEPNLTITVNGTEVKGQWVPLQPWAATQGADELAFSFTFDIFRTVSGGYIQDFRRWGFMELDPILWENAEQIVLELVGTGEDAVTLWGDYVDDPAIFVGPSMRPWDDSRSLFRFQWAKDDRRVTVANDLQGLDYFAQRGVGAGESLQWSEDLATASGVQSGRYRAYVLWLGPEDRLPYAPP